MNIAKLPTLIRSPQDHDGAPDCGEYCQTARAIAEGLICLTKIKVLPSTQSLSFFGRN